MLKNYELYNTLGFDTAGKEFIREELQQALMSLESFTI